MALPDTPLTRGEVYLDAIANSSSDVPTPLTREEEYLAAIATGDTSGIPSAPLTRTEQYLDYIAQNGGGGGGGAVDPEADVRFFDPYDGSIVASYSAADFANLSALPANPTHTGLTSQGWNWTLADAKEQVAWAGFLDIGQQYVPTDGKTHLHVHLIEGALSPKIGLQISGTVAVDWGDGSEASSQTGSNYASKSFEHTYSAPGDYDIKISGGKHKFYGYNYGSYIFTPISYGSSYNKNAVYLTAVQGIELGPDAELGTRAFAICKGIKYITIPSSLSVIGENSFATSGIQSVSIPSGVEIIPASCFSSSDLELVSIPKSATSIKEYAFQSTNIVRCSLPKNVSQLLTSTFSTCKRIKRFTIPQGVTALPASFANACTIKELSIPSNITSIGNSAFSASSLISVRLNGDVITIDESAFNACDRLREIELPSTVTTLGKKAFYGCSAISHISIPATVASIGTDCFNACNGISILKFLGPTPPTVGTSAFANLASPCKILVPAGSLSDYTGTANMPSSQSYTYEEY